MSLNANHVTNLLNIDGTTVDLVDINSGIEAFKAQISQGRLTLTSNTPVLSSNVTGATTLYYTPYTGSQISIWDGSKWSVRTFTEQSLSLSGLAANTNYDVFVFDNAGTLTLEAVAWSNSGAGTSARASALSFLNGVRVKDSDKRKYLGSFRTTATIGQTEFVNNNLPSSLLIKNEFNRIPLSLFLQEGSTAHTYTTNTWRNYNNSNTYKFNLLTIDNENIDFSLNLTMSNSLHITVSISNTIWNNIYWGLTVSDAIFIRASASLSTTVNGFNDFQIVERGNGTVAGSSQQLSAYLQTHY
jgi:hypothetical protein